MTRRNKKVMMRKGDIQYMQDRKTKKKITYPYGNMRNEGIIIL